MHPHPYVRIRQHPWPQGNTTALTRCLRMITCFRTFHAVLYGMLWLQKEGAKAQNEHCSIQFWRFRILGPVAPCTNHLPTRVRHVAYRPTHLAAWASDQLGMLCHKRIGQMPTRGAKLLGKLSVEQRHEEITIHNWIQLVTSQRKFADSWSAWEFDGGSYKIVSSNRQDQET